MRIKEYFTKRVRITNKEGHTFEGMFEEYTPMPDNKAPEYINEVETITIETDWVEGITMDFKPSEIASIELVVCQRGLELKLWEYLDKQVKITDIDGGVLIGYGEDYTQPLDNPDGIETFSVRSAVGASVLFRPTEILSIEVIGE